MPIVQISRIQHRRGKRTDLPQLAAGELGWVIDEQRLFIGNGTIADGAPAVGNTEILTSGAGVGGAALNYVYKGYLGNASPITTGDGVDFARTLQTRLDDFASVKQFDVKGDGSTNDTASIQRALDELYSNTDQDDARSRRALYFPAGTYVITSSLTIPPYAHLIGEGPDKTIISNSSASPVAVTEDDDGQGFGSIGNSGATVPTQIQISNITFKNTNISGYGGVSIDNATKLYFHNCKFEGTYTSGGADVSTSKGITVRSTSALPCANIYFNHCQFTKFARLVDLSYNVTNVRFNDCDFNTAYYGAMLGETMDGSTNGLTIGPRDIQFTGNSWSTIGQQAIYVKQSSSTTGTGTRNVISSGNWYASTVGNNFEGIGSIREVPVLQFDNDECTSTMDFFERSDLRRADGSSELNAAPELQGIGIQDKAIKSITLTDATSGATINEYPALAGKGFIIKYKIVRGTSERTGEFVISGSTNSPLVSGTYKPAYDDEYRESNGDVGVELTADIVDKDSTSGTETLRLLYTTTSTGSDATLDYQTTIIA